MSDRDRLLHGKASVFEEIGHELRGVGGLPDRLDADPEKLERGLAQLVLTVIELLRQLMELQALRRVESGRLSDEEVERLGQSLKALDERMTQLTTEFGLERQDLNLNLGPLGDLM